MSLNLVITLCHYITYFIYLFFKMKESSEWSSRPWLCIFKGTDCSETPTFFLTLLSGDQLVFFFFHAFSSFLLNFFMSCSIIWFFFISFYKNSYSFCFTIHYPWIRVCYLERLKLFSNQLWEWILGTGMNCATKNSCSWS